MSWEMGVFAPQRAMMVKRSRRQDMYSDLTFEKTGKEISDQVQARAARLKALNEKCIAQINELCPKMRKAKDGPTFMREYLAAAGINRDGDDASPREFMEEMAADAPASYYGLSKRAGIDGDDDEPTPEQQVSVLASRYVSVLRLVENFERIAKHIKPAAVFQLSYSQLVGFGW
jgi:hypothetical protein